MTLDLGKFKKEFGEKTDQFREEVGRMRENSEITHGKYRITRRTNHYDFRDMSAPPGRSPSEYHLMLRIFDDGSFTFLPYVGERVGEEENRDKFRPGVDSWEEIGQALHNGNYLDVVSYALPNDHPLRIFLFDDKSR